MHIGTSLTNYITKSRIDEDNNDEVTYSSFFIKCDYEGYNSSNGKQIYYYCRC